MIDIPLGKALIALEKENYCDGCYFKIGGYCQNDSDDLACSKTERKDDKSVIFRLVDLPAGFEGEKGGEQ